MVHPTARQKKRPFITKEEEVARRVRATSPKVQQEYFQLLMQQRPEIWHPSAQNITIFFSHAQDCITEVHPERLVEIKNAYPGRTFEVVGWRVFRAIIVDGVVRKFCWKQDLLTAPSRQRNRDDAIRHGGRVPVGSLFDQALGGRPYRGSFARYHGS